VSQIWTYLSGTCDKRTSGSSRNMCWHKERKKGLQRCQKSKCPRMLEFRERDEA